ncbi:hypothetical protein BGZ76_007144 [Entomortierella beljakovae]|nr:hypothetical protein BGZ76_007144 [Entomortierella beljakovae]
MDRTTRTTTIRLPPPSCFCGLPATSLFPDPDSETSRHSNHPRNKNIHTSQFPLRNGQNGHNGPSNSYNTFGYNQNSFKLKRPEHPQPSFYVSTPKTPNCNWVYECYYTSEKDNSQILDDNPPLSSYHFNDKPGQWQRKNTDSEPLGLVAEIRPWDEHLPQSSGTWIRGNHERSVTSSSIDSQKGSYDLGKSRDTRTFNIILANSGLPSPAESSASSSATSSSSSPSSSSLSTIKEDRGDDASSMETKPSDHDPRLGQSKQYFFEHHDVSINPAQNMRVENKPMRNLGASFFATATPYDRRPEESVAVLSTTPSMTKPSSTTSRSIFVTEIESNLPTAPLLTKISAAASPQMTQHTKSLDSKVCGFHMHGLEWHKMQQLKYQDQITLVERAQCPIFNFSVTRWMDDNANHLQKEPFNAIQCLCGEPMIVAPDIPHRAQEGYNLVCPKSMPGYCNIPGSEPMYNNNNSKNTSKWNQGSLRDDGTGESNQIRSEQRKYRDSHEPCPKVIPMNDIKYPPRSHPVHLYLQNDEWIERCFWPRPTRRSYFMPNHDPPRRRGHHLKSILNQSNHRYPLDYSKFRRRESFNRQKSVSFKSTPNIFPILESKVFDGPSKDDERCENSSSEWPIPDWCEQSMSISEAIHFKYPFNGAGLWSGNNLQSLNKWGVSELDDSLFQISIKKAIEGAEEYVNRYEQKVMARLEIQKSRRKEIEDELEEVTSEAAKLAIEVKRMDENAKEMPHKCRICFENFSTHAVIPCFHLVMCEGCVNQVEDCIICRVPKIDVQRIYWG